MELFFGEAAHRPGNGQTLVIDLDGTICEQTSGGSEYARALPKLDVISKLWEFSNAGWRIVIHTARGMRTFKNGIDAEIQYRDMTEEWLYQHEVPFDSLVFGKPAGDAYVDDKGVSIEGFLRKEIH